MHAGHHGGGRRTRTLGVRVIPAALAVAAVLGSSGAGVLAQDASFTPERRSDIPGVLPVEDLKLWVYDKDTGSYGPVDGDASQPYVPNLRAFPQGTVIGFAEGLAAIPFSHVINEDVYRYADELGYKVAYCDNNYDEALAVSCAETITQQAPNFVIESNWRAGVAQKVMDIFDAAKIPVVSVDVFHPNAIFLGADNWTSGFIAGQAAGKHADGLGKCADAWILLGVNPGEGDAANERLSGFKEGVQSVCGAIPDDRIDEFLNDAQDSVQSLTIATDWLTAHPQASYVLSSTIDDARSDGVARALTQSGRDGVAVGQGCDDIGIAATRIPVAENHFLGCVAFFPEKYGDYAISIAADVLEGKPVPQEVHLQHVFLDESTIDSVYPQAQ